MKNSIRMDDAQSIFGRTTYAAGNDSAVIGIGRANAELENSIRMDDAQSIYGRKPYADGNDSAVIGIGRANAELE